MFASFLPRKQVFLQLFSALFLFFIFSSHQKKKIAQSLIIKKTLLEEALEIKKDTSRGKIKRIFSSSVEKKWWVDGSRKKTEKLKEDDQGTIFL